MSTYLELPAPRRRLAEARRVEGRSDGGRSGRPAILVACAELWARTAGGRVDRMPDPARHPECWFKFV